LKCEILLKISLNSAPIMRIVRAWGINSHSRALHHKWCPTV
jgi:hypothetical protein